LTPKAQQTYAQHNTATHTTIQHSTTHHSVGWRNPGKPNDAVLDNDAEHDSFGPALRQRLVAPLEFTADKRRRAPLHRALPIGPYNNRGRHRVSSVIGGGSFQTGWMTGSWNLNFCVVPRILRSSTSSGIKGTMSSCTSPQGSRTVLVSRPL
jgi:hypothetical protein